MGAGGRRFNPGHPDHSLAARRPPPRRLALTTIDQQTRRRTTRLGLTALDEDRACPGYVLFTPNFGSGEPRLIDLRGNTVHRWQMPYPPGFWGYLLPNGNLFYGGKVTDDGPLPFPFWAILKGGAMLEADWQGNVLWEHKDPMHHHDARRTESGGAIYLGLYRVPTEFAAQVKGGIPVDGDEEMWADEIVEVDAAGNRVWSWRAHEHLDVETEILTFNDPRENWTHGNTIVPLPGDRVMVSFRSISTVGIIDKATGDFEWKLGGDVLAQQHDPSMLDNGNVLIFDNGTHRRDNAFTYSRVIEVDPSTNEIVWEYQDRPSLNFHSNIISGARRLPNGNTIITEGFFGRMFQVTPEGKVVWEYINPEFAVDPGFGEVNAVFRAEHYMPGEIPGL